MNEREAPLGVRKRYLTAALALVAALALILLLTVWWRGNQTVLEVVTVTGVPQCTGTEPVTTHDFLGSSTDDFERTAIPMTRGFECLVPVKVVNDSDRGVTLRQVSVGIGGVRAGSSFQVRYIDGTPPAKDEETEAVVSLDHALGPGEDYVVNVLVHFRASGCDSDGGLVSVTPHIRVRSAIASRDVGVGDWPLFQGTADSSCDT